LTKKEAEAAPPAAYQWQHHHENVQVQTTSTYLTYLQYLNLSDYQVISLKNTIFFCYMYSVMSRLMFLGGGGGASLLPPTQEHPQLRVKKMTMTMTVGDHAAMTTVIKDCSSRGNCRPSLTF
jgi:hypothetical protein